MSDRNGRQSYMLGLSDGEWTFRQGKHKGEALDFVAEEDPGYIAWVMAAVDDLDDEQIDALQEMVDEYDIEIVNGPD